MITYTTNKNKLRMIEVLINTSSLKTSEFFEGKNMTNVETALKLSNYNYI